MIRKYHTLQTNPQHREEESQNTKSQKTYIERYITQILLDQGAR